MGRRKISIKPIENERVKNVTQSRRTQGAIKKSHELSVLCNCQVMFLMFDERNNCHLYSSEEPETMMQRFTDIATSSAPDRSTNSESAITTHQNLYRYSFAKGTDPEALDTVSVSHETFIAPPSNDIHRPTRTVTTSQLPRLQPLGRYEEIPPITAIPGLFDSIVPPMAGGIPTFPEAYSLNYTFNSTSSNGGGANSSFNPSARPSNEFHSFPLAAINHKLSTASEHGFDLPMIDYLRDDSSSTSNRSTAYKHHHREESLPTPVSPQKHHADDKPYIHKKLAKRFNNKSSINADTDDDHIHHRDRDHQASEQPPQQEQQQHAKRIKHQ